MKLFHHQESITYRPCITRKLLILRLRNSISDRLLGDFSTRGDSRRDWEMQISADWPVLNSGQVWRNAKAG
jgi:hypothetical protein